MASRNGSRAWRAVFDVLYWLTPSRLSLFLLDRNPSRPLREVLLVSRRTGLQRRIVLSIFEISGHWYVGHPNGESGLWVPDMLAARSAIVVGRDSQHVKVACIPLAGGAERNAVVDASGRQPFPANLLYRAARGHVAVAAQCFRLQPVDGKTIR